MTTATTTTMAGDGDREGASQRERGGRREGDVQRESVRESVCEIERESLRLVVSKLFILSFPS